jgi:hypothetical protein
MPAAAGALAGSLMFGVGIAHADTEDQSGYLAALHDARSGDVPDFPDWPDATLLKVGHYACAQMRNGDVDVADRLREQQMFGAQAYKIVGNAQHYLCPDAVPLVLYPPCGPQGPGLDGPACWTTGRGPSG